MSDFACNQTEASRSALLADPGDYIALLKPRVMSLVIFTTLTGFLLAPTLPHPVIAIASLLAIAIGAGASGALNMWWDADIDAIMSRTANRPIPAGRLEPEEALSFGLILSVLSVMTLGLVANWLAAGLLAFTIFFYVVVYSMWLKRSTPLNIVIGGAAGALPPMVGYAAATGELSLSSFVLFAIIFIWTPPHFWALALVKAEDYGRAGVPMLPNVAGERRTKVEILIYAVLLAPLGVAPTLLGFAGFAYGVIAALGGAGMVGLAAQLMAARSAESSRRACWRLFGFSIAYLFVLFLTLAIERGAQHLGFPA